MPIFRTIHNIILPCCINLFKTSVPFKNDLVRCNRSSTSSYYHRCGFPVTGTSLNVTQKAISSDKNTAQNSADNAIYNNNIPRISKNHRSPEENTNGAEASLTIHPIRSRKSVRRSVLESDPMEKLRRRHNHLYDIMKQVPFHFMIFSGMFAVTNATDDGKHISSVGGSSAGDTATVPPKDDGVYCTCDDDSKTKNPTDMNSIDRHAVPGEKKRFRGVLQFCRGPQMVVPHPHDSSDANDSNKC